MIFSLLLLSTGVVALIAGDRLGRAALVSLWLLLAALEVAWGHGLAAALHGVLALLWVLRRRSPGEVSEAPAGRGLAALWLVVCLALAVIAWRSPLSTPSLPEATSPLLPTPFEIVLLAALVIFAAAVSRARRRNAAAAELP